MAPSSADIGRCLKARDVWELPVRLCVVVCLALPALLPILAVRCWSGRSEKRNLLYLVLCVIALVASTYPRSDVAHLAYVAALPYAVAGILIYRLLPTRPRAWLTISIAVWAAVFAWQAAAPRASAVTAYSGRRRSGQCRGSSRGRGSACASAPAPVAVRVSLQAAALLPDASRKSDALLVSRARNDDHSRTHRSRSPNYKPVRPNGCSTWTWIAAEFERVFPAGKGFDAHYPRARGLDPGQLSDHRLSARWAGMFCFAACDRSIKKPPQLPGRPSPLICCC